MELAFENPELREICENNVQGESELGKRHAVVLRQCLADLLAADSLADLPDSPEKTQDGHFRITDSSGMAVTFSVNHSNLAGPLDRSRVRRIKILSLNKK